MSFPRDPYGDIPDNLQDLFWDISGTDYIENADLDYAQTLYAVGFGFHADDYDRMGFDMDAVHAARENFFDFMGLEWEDFPWAEWREEMGYDEG